MTTTLEDIRRQCKARMGQSMEYFDRELRGIRTGRATTALIDYVKVNYYGNPTDLRELAAVTVPEPTRLLVKPFDPSSKDDIVKAIEVADLGLNPQVDGQTIRISVPAPSAERRQQLVGQVRKMAEEARVTVRNERRDAIRHIEQLVKQEDNHVSEDQGRDARGVIDELTKEHTRLIDEHMAKKVTEVETT